MKKIIKKLIRYLGYELQRPIGDEYYYYDGLRTHHNHNFMEDPDFISAYKFAIDKVGRDYKIYWRTHIALSCVLWAINQKNSSFSECGVADGFTSLVICKYLQLKKIAIPNFYLFDSFQGLNTAQIPREETSYWGESAEQRQRKYIESTYTDGWDESKVIERFKVFPTVKIFKGFVPEILNENLEVLDEKKFSFIHIDMNNSTPEVAAANFFITRVADSAIILLDDYAYHGYGYQKIAMDRWAKENNQIIASLPTGQGLIVVNRTR
jgi:hypothetical protein